MPWLDPLLAVLMLLPAAWLLLPPVLAGQLEPELAASGWWVLLQILPTLLLFARAPRPRVPIATVYLLFVAASLLQLQILPVSDSLSATRAVLVAIASSSALIAGSALGVLGRRVLAVGLVVLSIGACVGALAGASP